MELQDCLLYYYRIVFLWKHLCNDIAIQSNYHLQIPTQFYSTYCLLLDQQPAPSSVITGTIETIVDRQHTNITINIVAIEKNNYTLFTIMTSNIPIQFRKHLLLILPSISSANWVYGKSLSSTVSRTQFQKRNFRRKVTLY